MPHYKTDSDQFFQNTKVVRPLMSWNGNDMWKMTDNLFWVDLIYTSKQKCIGIYLEGDKVYVASPQVHEKREAAMENLKQLRHLLKVLFKVEPSKEEIAEFGDRPIEWGTHLLKNWPNYKLKPYDHFIICHAWEWVEKYGGLGKLSSIICEASNADLKDTLLNHESGVPGNKSAAGLARMQDKSELQVSSVLP